MRTPDLRRQVVDVREVVAAGAQVRRPLLQRVEPAVQVGEATPAAHLHALHACMPRSESTCLDFRWGLSCKRQQRLTLLRTFPSLNLSPR